jgi:hypothetical protein
MKNKHLLHILFLGCVFFTISCKFNKNNANNNFNAVKDTLSYTFFSIDTLNADCKKVFKHCPTVKISYPVFNAANKSLNDFLNNEINKMILYKSDTSTYASVTELIQSYFNDNKDMKQQGDYDDESSAWEIEKTVTVLNKTNKFITIAFTDYGYTGGAHPYGSTIYKNYDVVAKKQLKIDEVLNVNDTALLRLGEHYFRRNNEINDTMKLSDVSFFIFGEGEDFEDGPNYGKFHFNDNFAFTKDGIEFQYNSYEMSPYAAGAPSFTIPYEKIIPFLKLTIW